MKTTAVGCIAEPALEMKEIQAENFQPTSTDYIIITSTSEQN